MRRVRARVLFAPALCLLCIFCNRSVGGGLAHVAPPNPDGTPCNFDVECASDNCSGPCQPDSGAIASCGGTCVSPANGAVEIDGDCSGGSPCVADATCQDGICVETVAACAALLAPCGVDADCCSGACATPEYAPGCAPTGSCVIPDECCSGICATSGDGKGSCVPMGTCTAGAGACVAEGGTCALDSDCCAGLCDFRESTNALRGQCSTSCKGLSATCQGGDCCDGFCHASVGQCQSCALAPDYTSNPCTSDLDCCGTPCGSNGICSQ